MHKELHISLDPSLIAMRDKFTLRNVFILRFLAERKFIKTEFKTAEQLTRRNPKLRSEKSRLGKAIEKYLAPRDPLLYDYAACK